MSKNKFDDDMYTLLNYCEVDDKIEAIEIDNLSKERIKRKIKKNKRSTLINKRNIAIAAVSLFVAGNILIVSNGGVSVYANMKQSIIQTFMNITGKSENYDEYLKSVDLSFVDKGIELKIKEVVADGNLINLSYILKSENKLKELVENPQIMLGTFKIGDEDISGYGSLGDMKDDYTYEGVITINKTKVKSDKEAYTLNMSINTIGNLDGTWNLDIKIDERSAKEKSKTYDVSKRVELGDGKYFDINKIVSTPLSTAIRATGKVNGDYDALNYYIVDNKGNEIKGIGTSVERNLGLDNISIVYESLANEEIERLTLIPYRINPNYKVNPYEVDMSKLPTKISFNDIGDITIEKAQWIDDNTLKVNYEINSLIPVTLSSAVSAVIDDNGNRIISESKYNTQTEFKDQKNFTMTFTGLDRNNEYKLSIPRMDEYILMDKENSFDIDVNK